MKEENKAHTQEWHDGFFHGKAEARKEAGKYQLLSVLLGFIVVMELVNWLAYPKTICWPAEDENAVISTTTQPFHKTEKLLLRWHKEDGVEGWAWKDSSGWRYIEFGKSED
jgi:hypothetical protein